MVSDADPVFQPFYLFPVAPHLKGIFGSEAEVSWRKGETIYATTHLDDVHIQFPDNGRVHYSGVSKLGIFGDKDFGQIVVQRKLFREAFFGFTCG